MMVMGSKDLVDLLSQSIAMLEVDMLTGVINWASQPLENMFGYNLSGDLEGKLVETLMPDGLRKTHSDVHRPTFAADPHARMMGRALTLRGQKRDGSEFPVEIMLLPKAVNKIKVVLGIVFDMTNRQLGEHSNGLLNARPPAAALP